MQGSGRNLIDAELAAFMESPVMMIIGSCGDGLRPDIARAAGAIVARVEDQVDLIVSAWQWPDTIANVHRNGRLSVTFARPADYVSYQAKGRATVIPTVDAHRARSQHYIAAMTETLVGLGLHRAVIAPWLVDREPQVVRLAVDMIFIQTPGERAGRVHEPAR